MTAKIKLNAASGGGSFSLQAPSSSANNRVFTIPDEADATLLTSNTSTGKILQVVQTVKKDKASTSLATNTNSTAFESVTGCTIAITPSSSSNKILVDFELVTAQSRNDNLLMFTLSRKIGSGSFAEVTDYIGDSDGNRHRCSVSIVPSTNTFATNQVRLQFLDSPSTTDAVTYGFRVRHDSGSTSSIYINSSNDDGNQVYVPRPCSTLILKEVAA